MRRGTTPSAHLDPIEVVMHGIICPSRVSPLGERLYAGSDGLPIRGKVVRSVRKRDFQIRFVGWSVSSESVGCC